MALGVGADDQFALGGQSALQRERLDLLAELVVFGELVLRLPFGCLFVVLGTDLNPVFFDHLCYKDIDALE